MSNLTNLNFTALDFFERNYLSWILDAEVHMTSMNLRETIKEGNKTSQHDHAKALILFFGTIFIGI